MFLTARKHLLRCVSLGFSLLAFALLSEAQNITGRIVANGKPLKGVVVSDGVEVTTTDGNGHYELQSGKENGYVFYSLPRGYEPAYSRGFLPRIWSPLNSKDVSTDEVHDFELSRLKGSTDKYVMLFGADVHLAKRNDDLKQFDGFLSALERERERAGKRAVHTMFLGDISWDNYWTSMKFGLPELVDFLEQSRYPVPMWPVMGNHDHDPSIPDGTQTDVLSAGVWRNVMGPNYYSFNLGRVHYVVLDDIVYKNEDTGGKYRKGVVGSRNYDAVLTKEQLDWLEKDL
ncbi:MAG: metallophosphoesterase, partial [Bacteroidaceae bacterium]|nr:metallophosphoesterase [Bacteroidaceae bacterium]